MMLEKYGATIYLKRRWARIGLTLLIGIFTFGCHFIYSLEIWCRDRWDHPREVRARPASGPVHQVCATKPLEVPSFRGRPRGPVSSLILAKEIEENPREVRDSGLEEADRGWCGTVWNGRESWADRIFGVRASPYVQLHHLWFLWYLLIFATIAPGISTLLGWVWPRSLERPARLLVDWGLAPLALGLACIRRSGWQILPDPLSHSRPPFFGRFPTFCFMSSPTWVFYLIFFLAGWWLHRDRESLPGACFAHALGAGAGNRPGGVHLCQRQFPGAVPDAGRIIPIDAFDVLGANGLRPRLGIHQLRFSRLFQRYLDKPNAVWRYLADTALWVYLIHQPFVILALFALKRLNLVWWIQAPVVTLMATAAALMFYEAIVRPTPLVRLFGPAGARRSTRASGAIDET